MRTKYLSIIFSLIVFLAVFGVVYYYYQDTYRKSILGTSDEIHLPSLESIEATRSGAEIPNQWLTFRSDSFGYTLRYPLDVKAEMTVDGDRFLKMGPTQSVGTELFDGLALIIRSGKLGSKTLEQLAKDFYQKEKSDKNSKTISDLGPVTFGTHQGYKFRESNSGESDHIFLPAGPDQYLEIINRTVEPKERGGEFQKTVEKMLTSITF